MQAVAHNPAFAHKVGVPVSIGKEFAAADKGHHFAAGGVAGLGRPHFDFGGSMGMMPPRPTYASREDLREIMNPTGSGPIMSEIPGRLDHIPMSPAADSFVIPADVVSGLGSGNSLAGAKFLNSVFGTGPYGTPLPRGRGGGHSIPAPPRPSPMGGTTRMTTTGAFAKGGKTSQPIGHHPPVQIMAAGMEHLVDPWTIVYHRLLGNLNPNDHDPKHYKAALDRGHAILREFVVQERKKLIKTLQKLPPPHR